MANSLRSRAGKINAPGLGPKGAARVNMAVLVCCDVDKWVGGGMTAGPVRCAMGPLSLAVGGFHAQLAPLTERAPFFLCAHGGKIAAPNLSNPYAPSEIASWLKLPMPGACASARWSI